MTSQQLVMAFQARSSAEAELVRAILEAEGVYAVVLDRNNPIPVDMTPFDGNYTPLGTAVYVGEGALASARSAIEAARDAGRLLDEDADVGAPLEDEDGGSLA